MEDEKHTTSVTFEIDNYSENSMISLESFLSGGYKWNLTVFPKGVVIDYRDMYLYLRVKNHPSLRLGWKIRASFSFLVLNQSLKELCRLDEPCQLFCAKSPGNGCCVPLEKLQELENNKLILKVQVKVLGEGDISGNDILVIYSKVLFKEHPDIGESLREKDQLAAYMNDVLVLFWALRTDPFSFSETELSKATMEWIKLTEAAGFEVKIEHGELYLERKKAEPNKETKARDWLQGVVHSCKVRVGFAHVGKDKLD